MTIQLLKATDLYEVWRIGAWIYTKWLTMGIGTWNYEPLEES